MELDKRIKKGKRPLTCFDLKEAEEFIGEKGYFAHCIDYYADLENTVFGTLSSTEDGDHSSFVCTEETFNNYYYHFFIPEDWVLPEVKPEKKYRAFTLAEWINQHEIGDVIHYRSKSERIEAHIMYMGTYHHKNKGTIVLGVASFTLDCLFEDCEIEINGEWLPFGVIEDD